MKQIDSSELKTIQLGILNYFDDFCRRNDIHYWLDFGTLLGAVRHKGFIPWDDDIDIAMLRGDYERAAEIFNKQSNGLYLFNTPCNDTEHCYPFGKLINTSTVLYEYGEAGIKTSVYVDVFVYDNSPDDEKEVKRIFKKRDFLGRIRRIKLPMRKGISKNKEAVYKFGSFLLQPISRNAINRAIDRNARKYERIETKKVSPFADPYDETYFAIPKSLFQNLTEIEFEGKKYPVPRDYDYWLTFRYGKYMELPPVENRVNKHTFEAFYIDE